MTRPSTSVPIMPPIQSAKPRGGAVRGDGPADGAEDEHDREEAERLHDDVVHGDPTGVDRAGGRLVVQVLQLLRGHPRGGGLGRGGLLGGAGAGAAEAGVAVLGVLLDPVEGRVAGHRSSVMVMAVAPTARVRRVYVRGGCGVPAPSAEAEPVESRNTPSRSGGQRRVVALAGAGRRGAPDGGRTRTCGDFKSPASASWATGARPLYAVAPPRVAGSSPRQCRRPCYGVLAGARRRAG